MAEKASEVRSLAPVPVSAAARGWEKADTWMEMEELGRGLGRNLSRKFELGFNVRKLGLNNLTDRNEEEIGGWVLVIAIFV